MARAFQIEDRVTVAQTQCPSYIKCYLSGTSPEYILGDL